MTLPTPAAAGAFLLKNWLPALLALALIVQTVRIEGFGIWPLKIPGLQDKYDTAVRKLGVVRGERDQLIAAAKEAERLNKEQVNRIVTDQDRISNEIERDLTARLERLRSELRAKANNGHSQGPGAGSNGKAPGGVDEEAGVCLAPDELLRAAENEERHDQLITWIEEQLKVRR